MPRKVILPDLAKVWLPAGHDRRSLRIGKRPRYDRTNCVDATGDVYVCRPVCGKQCWYVNPRTGTRCRRKTCIDYRYCTQHLIDEKHLYIGARSRHLNSLSPPIPQRGLYAVRDGKTLKELGFESRGVPNTNMRDTVFRRGDVIDVYGGEQMTKEELDARYEYPDAVASYSVNDYDRTIDAFCATTAGAYANDPYDARDGEDRFLMANRKQNAAAVLQRRGEFNGLFVMKALRAIHHGEEILYSYGPEYWEPHEDENSLCRRR